MGLSFYHRDGTRSSCMHTREVSACGASHWERKSEAAHDLQNHADALRRERERRCADEQRLHHILLQDVRDRALRRDASVKRFGQLEGGKRRRTRRTLIPAQRSPFAWRFRNSVTVRRAFKPAFCANVYGTTSSACGMRRQVFAQLSTLGLRSIPLRTR